MLFSYELYRKKLRGCFIGKTIGGTLGMPNEGYLGTKEVTYYDPVPTAMVPNDDLDLQVVWLEVIRRRGLPINCRDLADGWLDHMRGLPDEYGVTVKNLETGIYPPLSGRYDNKFGAGMGAAIRTEIWAALAPGDPDLAVRFARMDATVDHYDEGVEAAVFLAAVESAAYVDGDYLALIRTGMSYLDPNGKMYRAFSDVIEWWRELHDILAVRERILTKYFSQNWTNVVINLSLILLSWISSEGDFSRAICTAAGLGYDTDCTAATLGAIMGILNPDGFEERWLKPIGDDLVLSSCIANMHEVSTITELCEQIADVCVETLTYYNSDTELVNAPPLKGDRAKPWAKNDHVIRLRKDVLARESIVSVRPFSVRLIYPEKYAIAPGETAKFGVYISDPNGIERDVTVTLHAPDGFIAEPAAFTLKLKEEGGAYAEFTVTAPSGGRRRARNPLDIVIGCGGLDFAVSAEMIQTIDFLRVPCESVGMECPELSAFENAERVSAPGHIQKVPDGGWLYTAEFRTPMRVDGAIFLGQGTRAMKVWLDGNLLMDHDASEYVPAFHRTDYIARCDLKGDWQRLVVWVDSKERKGEDRIRERSPKNAIVPVDFNPTTFELRQKYDAKTLLDGEDDAELFLGFASVSGYFWLSEMEWRC